MSPQCPICGFIHCRMIDLKAYPPDAKPVKERPADFCCNCREYVCEREAGSGGC